MKLGKYVYKFVFLLVKIWEKNYYCKNDDREIDICSKIYNPVCGWNDSKKIQYIKYLCADTYSNKCEVCKNDNVLYTTDGECPA